MIKSKIEQSTKVFIFIYEAKIKKIFHEAINSHCAWAIL